MRSDLSHLSLDSFCPRFYLALYPDLLRTLPWNPQAALHHYLEYGIRQGRCPNPFFDPAYYVRLYPDVGAQCGGEDLEQALAHWLSQGIPEGRRGSPTFDLNHYGNAHPDVHRFASGDPGLAFAHWKRSGFREERTTTPEGPHLGIVPCDLGCTPFVNLGDERNLLFFRSASASGTGPFRFLDAYLPIARALRAFPRLAFNCRLCLPAEFLQPGPAEEPLPALGEVVAVR